MPGIRYCVLLAALLLGACLNGPAARADSCQEMVARHLVGEALLAANYVAAAEKAGMKPAEINAALKAIAAKSAIQEFWITDSSGKAYLNNAGIDFTFSPERRSSRRRRPSGR